MMVAKDIPGQNPWPDLPAGPLVAPSLLSVDFARAGEQIDAVLASGVRLLHVDIMDGHFVPNLSMGTPVVEKLRKYTTVPLDVHLMVTDPAFFAERFAEAGADSLNFHIEATDHPAKLIKRIREMGLGVGVTLKPMTPAKRLAKIIDQVDLVLVMTVEPGFGGQAFMDNQLPKIEQLRSMMTDGQWLEVDGGIDTTTARKCLDAGANLFVAGSSIFGAPDPGAAAGELQEALTNP